MREERKDDSTRTSDGHVCTSDSDGAIDVNLLVDNNIGQLLRYLEQL